MEKPRRKRGFFVANRVPWLLLFLIRLDAMRQFILPDSLQFSGHPLHQFLGAALGYR